MSESVLISFVGKGNKYDNNKKGYDLTTYKFPGGAEYETALFAKAILESKYKNVQKVCFVGTITSSWDIILDEKDDFWSKVLIECSSIGLQEETKNQLEVKLSNQFHMPVSLCVHDDEINAETIPDIFRIYNETIEKFITEKDMDILFDITHGFRSMPLLVYQALQFGVAGLAPKKVSLIYGELRKEEGAKSPVHDLSQYWRLSKITEALNLFFRKFNSARLVELLQPELPDLAKLIKDFGTIVECNFSFRIVDWLKNAKKVLNEPVKDTEPDWVKKVREFLQNELVNKIDFKYTSDILRAYFEVLKDRQLYVQAAITLQVALETRYIEAYGTIEDIAVFYAWIDKYKKDFHDVQKRLGIDLGNIENLRNVIAHAGSKDERIHTDIKTIEKIFRKKQNEVQVFFDNIQPKK